MLKVSLLLLSQAERCNSAPYHCLSTLQSSSDKGNKLLLAC
jgi:hypothetical protein